LIYGLEYTLQQAKKSHKGKGALFLCETELV
ncbi:hypothetical protein BMETH_3683194395, partial [methanotrophic bacterial endosymbiont of Bathymodiolus sp.]